MKPISVQLYTLRDASAEDFPAVLRTVAEIGYKGVEIASLNGLEPKEVAKIISDLGMVVSSSHIPLPTPENIQEILDVELAMGNKAVISGFGPKEFTTVDACKAAAGKFQQAAALLKPHGISFGFHNHWWEFDKVDGKRIYDILIHEAPDAFSELDVYWTAAGKADPIEVVSQYKSRLPYLHIKDGMLEEGSVVHTAVGSGKLDIPGIIKAADPNVLKWLVVELDNCDTDMTEAVRQSYIYLTSNGLAAGNK